MTGAGVPFYVSVAAVAGHLAWQIRAVDLDSREDCMAKFVSNRDLGAVLFSGIVLDKLFA
jgi:4-hydroxybenzoate polyprenyltransferase